MAKAFVIGSQGLVDELALAGVEAVGGADPVYATRVFRSEAEFLEVGWLWWWVGVLGYGYIWIWVGVGVLGYG